MSATVIATASVSATTVISVPTMFVASGTATTSTAASATGTSPTSAHSRHLTARDCMYFWRPIHRIFYVCRSRIEVITQRWVAQDVGLQTNKASVSATTVKSVPTMFVASGTATTSTAASATATSPTSAHSRHLTARDCMYFWQTIHHIFYVCRSRIDQEAHL